MPPPGVAGSQIPDRSRRGAGPGFSPLRSLSYTAPGCGPCVCTASEQTKTATSASAGTRACFGMEGPSRQSIPGIVVAERQRRAVGKYDAQQTSQRPAILAWFKRDSHDVSDFERLLGEPLGQDIGAALRLHSPVHHLAVIARGVEPQEAMGIGPEPFDNGPLHRDFLSHVELRGAVVCEQRNRKRQEAKNYSDTPHQAIFHCDAS